MLPRSRDNEAVYRRGANFWDHRDLDQAMAALEGALAASRGPRPGDTQLRGVETTIEVGESGM